MKGTGSVSNSLTTFPQPTFFASPSCIDAAARSCQDSTIEIEIRCINPFTGTVYQNCNINIPSFSVTPGSGGHLHNTDRPKGSFDKTSGNSGASGVFVVHYTAPQASGETVVRVTGELANGIPVADGTFTIGVLYDGLVQSYVAGLYINSSSDMHGNWNGYAQPIFVDALSLMAQAYADGYKSEFGEDAQPDLITIVALSLPEGGLFDYLNEWSPPHVGHRKGVEADIRTRDKLGAKRQLLKDAIEEGGHLSMWVKAESPQNPNATHWHAGLR